MKSFADDSSGIAYGIGVLAVALVLFSLFYIAYSMFLSGIIDAHNTVMVPRDQVSIDRHGSMLFCQRMWLGMPFFFLIGASLWGIIRALEQKNTEAT